MKVVLFCGGLGTRIREYAENIPKPMIPIGERPLLLHLMKYYAQFGHTDFVLCLGYKGSVIREFFLNFRPHTFGDCIVSNSGNKIEMLDKTPLDWRISLLDTGLQRKVGERLWAVRDQVINEEMFLANYSDSLTDLDLSRMIEAFKASDKVGCFLAVRPQLSFHFAEFDSAGEVQAIRNVQHLDAWINGGFFIFRPEIFDYMRDGEELVEEPFARLIADKKLMTYRHEGFWRPMDTLKDKQALEDLVETGTMPWNTARPGNQNPPVTSEIVLTQATNSDGKTDHRVR